MTLALRQEDFCSTLTALGPLWRKMRQDLRREIHFLARPPHPLARMLTWHLNGSFNGRAIDTRQNILICRSPRVILFKTVVFYWPPHETGVKCDTWRQAVRPEHPLCRIFNDEFSRHSVFMGGATSRWVLDWTDGSVWVSTPMRSRRWIYNHLDKRLRLE